MPDVSSVLTFDQNPPHRPSLDELGGADKENELGFEPNPETDPTAEEDNQKTQQVAACARMIALARISIRWTGSAYAVDSFLCVSTGMITSTFVVARPSAGICTINWPADRSVATLPFAYGQPTVSPNAALSAGVPPWAENWNDGSGNPGVRIHLPSDGSFTVLVY